MRLFPSDKISIFLLIISIYTLIHGTQEGVSKLEEAKTLETIQAIYEAIFPTSHPSHRWLFAVPVEAKLVDNRTTQIAWIDSVRRLYPQQYKDIKTRIGKMDFRQEHLEYTLSLSDGAPAKYNLFTAV